MIDAFISENKEYLSYAWNAIFWNADFIEDDKAYIGRCWICEDYSMKWWYNISDVQQNNRPSIDLNVTIECLNKDCENSTGYENDQFASCVQQVLLMTLHQFGIYQLRQDYKNKIPLESNSLGATVKR